MTWTKKFAILILAVMFFLMQGSVSNDSATMDELAHIPAGFGYVTQGDYRLNPEHPPLLKTIAALSSLIFARPYFPTDTPYWQEEVNGQWAEGTKFLYESGNDADKIIFWARQPLILLSVFFGWLIFVWTKNKFGGATALLTLIFYAFSPTVLAHSRYVTTDLGAAFGFFIGIISFLWFLEKPTWSRAALAGAALGLAELLKFSLILLLPTYGVLLIFWVLVRPGLHWHERFRVLGRMVEKTLVLGVVGFSLVWVVYIPHVWNYPQEKQLRDAEFLLSSYGFRPAVNFDLLLINNRFTRPLGQYLLGFLMVNQRTAGGHTVVYLGEISGGGNLSYFPLLYLLKEPLALHVLTLIALWFGVKNSNFLNKGFDLERLRVWIESHFPEFSAILFIVLYWGVSIKSPLNIGIRHVLPTFPFIYILISRQIIRWARPHELESPDTWFGWLKNIYELYVASVPKYILVGGLTAWLMISVTSTYPHFLSYYNELGGGTRTGWRIAVDSNYDWGQDLKRLAEYVRKNNIDKIAVDYFGGGNPNYYLGDKVELWRSARGPVSGWFAISITLREGAFGKPVRGFEKKIEDSYEWLRPYPPVAQIGYSIFVYKLP